MKKTLLSVAFLGMAATAMAEAQIDFDPSLLPAGHSNVRVNGCISSFGMQPLGCFDAVVSSGGVPFMYQAVFQADGAVAAGMFTSITLTFECAGQDVSAVLMPAPFAMTYFAGPANPPLTPTVFPGVDAQMDCNGGGTQDANDLPVAFELGNAFPNPFNPSTTINFALPAAELVKLNVFNITGQKVATLVNEMMVRGTHEVTFDASALSSGVYMYTIEAGDFTATKKMVLVK
jgi:hypothetical protein